jgi:ABC-type glutathione transport system ATPase component
VHPTLLRRNRDRSGARINAQFVIDACQMCLDCPTEVAGWMAILALAAQNSHRFPYLHKERITSIAIQVNHLKKSFGDFQAVQDASFHADAGEVLSLLGPNGYRCRRSSTFLLQTIRFIFLWRHKNL